MGEKQEFDEGGVWEFTTWEVKHNLEAHDQSGTPCKHAYKVRGKLRTDSQGRTHCDSLKWTVPRVVVAYNEGGHNTTGVCLDCILEAFGCQRIVEAVE